MPLESQPISRRSFLRRSGVIVGGSALVGLEHFAASDRESTIEFSGNRQGKPLIIKPALIYQLFEKKEAVTWREWGGLRSQADVDREIRRIEQELNDLKARADFPIDILPLIPVNSDPAAKKVSECHCDAVLVYAAGSAGDSIYKQNRLDMITQAGHHNIIFLRHKSGPIYLWYEIVHPKLLRGATDDFTHEHLQVEDIVIDDYREVLWRLRALYGLKNIRETKLIAINGIGGWGAGGEVAPDVIKTIWNLEVAEVELSCVEKKMDSKLRDGIALQNARKEMDAYLDEEGILSVHTDKRFIRNAFLLKDVFRELMNAENAMGVTVRGCMSIGPIARTTACLPFSLINDDGYMAFCESDFVVIPAGILLYYIAGKPAFLNDPCLPHNGITTCAHCSAPRRMNGSDAEPTHIYTHCESDYGASPKVEFRKGQVVTNIIPDFNSVKWMGCRGRITDHPFYAICRSQFDCEIEGDWKRLRSDMRGFHWMTCYGDYLSEIGYVLGKVGIEWENISA